MRYYYLLLLMVVFQASMHVSAFAAPSNLIP